MELAQMAQWCFQLFITGMLGWVAYFIKQNSSRIEEKNKSQDNKIEEVKQELADLKADLPLIYVTREDYIRTMNNVNDKLDKIYDKMMKGGN